MNFIRFGIIVTGQGEAIFLASLFRSVMAAANCTFEIIRRSGQLSPITSERRILRMVGRGQRIPTIDEEQFGLPALGYLRRYPLSFVLIIDDLEGARRDQAAEVFARYRAALDTVLAGQNLSQRASVHFLVNMLEAYYFAHSDVINSVAGRNILPHDHTDDVEAIGHPKNEIRSIWPEFNEIEHGAAIVPQLDVQYILRTPNQCCSLRSLFSWCISQLSLHNSIYDDTVRDAFQIATGCQFDITANQ